jgi:CheY-like chemotaxis protein
VLAGARMPDSKVKLLIVDDDASIRMSLSHIFTSRGYNVRSVEDGSAALADMRAEIPDIVLSDLFMPGMSGFELLSLIRLHFPAIPVIAMSSAFSGGNVPPHVAADGFYEKATSLGSLFHLVESVKTISTGRKRRPLTVSGELPVASAIPA